MFEKSAESLNLGCLLPSKYLGFANKDILLPRGNWWCEVGLGFSLTATKGFGRQTLALQSEEIHEFEWKLNFVHTRIMVGGGKCTFEL